MKLITFCVPCYNSEAYLNKCVDSILKAGEDIEIILVNDGSFKDNTKALIDDYVMRYPNIIKAIHKENGGHGSAVNAGLSQATGTYYKVVDSDDWLNENALHKVMNQLRSFKHEIDMVIANYVYEHSTTNTFKVMSYTNVLPLNKEFTWDAVKRFKPSQYLLMHSVIYRTKLLKNIHLELPKHTFYVDNIYVYVPLPHVKSMYYMDEDLYRYFIGREDQSVNEKVMMTRVDQQIRVTKILVESYKSHQLKELNSKLFHYMTNYLSIMVSICSLLLIKIGDKEALKKREDLIEYLYEHDINLYRLLKYNRISSLMLFKNKMGMLLSLMLYKIARNIYRFN